MVIQRCLRSKHSGEVWQGLGLSGSGGAVSSPQSPVPSPTAAMPARAPGCSECSRPAARSDDAAISALQLRTDRSGLATGTSAPEVLLPHADWRLETGDWGPGLHSPARTHATPRETSAPRHSPRRSYATPRKTSAPRHPPGRGYATPREFLPRRHTTHRTPHTTAVPSASHGAHSTVASDPMQPSS